MLSVSHSGKRSSRRQTLAGWCGESFQGRLSSQILSKFMVAVIFHSTESQFLEKDTTPTETYFQRECWCFLHSLCCYLIFCYVFIFLFAHFLVLPLECKLHEARVLVIEFMALSLPATKILAPSRYSVNIGCHRNVTLEFVWSWRNSGWSRE